MKRILLTVIGMILLTACGGGGGGSSSSDNSGGGSETTKTTISGKVVSSSGYNVLVCFDRNGNKACDEGEPFTNVNTDGSYTIEGNSSDIASVPLIAELSNLSGVRSGTASNVALIYETPVGMDTISSITTIVKSKMDIELLSIDDATAKVKSDLSIGNPFDADANKDIADKVTAVMVELLTFLKSKGFNLSDKTILLISSEISSQLAVINTKTPEEIKDSTIGGKTNEQLEQEMNALDAVKPTVMTMGEALSEGKTLDMLTLIYEEMSGNERIYGIQRIFLSSNAGKVGQRSLADVRINNTFPDLLKTMDSTLSSDGVLIIVDEEHDHNSYIYSVKTIPLYGKVAQANPVFNNTVISGFNKQAKMYELTFEGRHRKEINISIDCLRQNIKQCGADNYDSNSRKEGNILKGYGSTGDNSYLGVITLGTNNTCTWESKKRANDRRPFETVLQYKLEGTYIQSGSGENLVIQCNTTDGSKFVYLSTSFDGSYGSMAEFLITNERYIYRAFNEEAMKTIMSDWNELITP